ncbi:MAG: 30S ribosomal protein S6 [Candidatus Wolfebacteria bacterium]|nr:30S ribosomal protein S6 [Candidatus Wolfebacteria bacterium]
MNEQELTKYETSFLSLKEEVKDDILKILRKNSAKIIKDGMPANIRLSYPIKKEESAFFTRLGFEADAAQIKKISDEIRLLKSVLRFLISKFDEKKAENERSRSSIWQAKRDEKLVGESSAGEAKAEAGRAAKESEIFEKAGDSAPKPVAFPGELTNEALEKKLEELLSE